MKFRISIFQNGRLRALHSLSFVVDGQGCTGPSAPKVLVQHCTLALCTLGAGNSIEQHNINIIFEDFWHTSVQDSEIPKLYDWFIVTSDGEEFFLVTFHKNSLCSGTTVVVRIGLHIIWPSLSTFLCSFHYAKLKSVRYAQLTSKVAGCTMT